MMVGKKIAKETKCSRLTNTAIAALSKNFRLNGQKRSYNGKGKW